jgi:hypothetical protein
MAEGQKAESVPVSLRALVQRVNRALKKKGRLLKAARGERARTEVGDYYLIDVERNFLTDKHVNVEVLGRELGVLQPWEVLAGEGGEHHG